MVRALREQDVVMSTPTSAAPRPRLLAVHAAWLFDGVGSELIADPLVVLDGATIVGSSGMNVGDWGGLAIGFSLWGNGLGLDRAGRYLYPFFPPAQQRGEGPR